MVIVLFYSIMTSVSNSHFQQYLNNEEMITSYLMCELHYKTVWQKKTIAEKLLQNMLHDKTISS